MTYLPGGINPHSSHPTSLGSLVSSVWRNRQLIKTLIKRDVVGRYRGSVMGLAWSFFNPILLLAVYTFVFSVIFRAKWGGDSDEGNAQFAIVLFVGMIMHGLFAEVLNRAPNLILQNANYVKKVVFPLEVLPIVSLGAAFFHATVSIGVLLIASFILNGYLHLTALLIPVVLFPLVLVTLGLAWMLASLGVFLRDVGQSIGLLTTVMLFLAPVFYPITAIPDEFRALLMINPLTFIIDQARVVLVWGRLPDWIGLGAYSGVAVFVLLVGYAWFQKTRKGFADVI